MEADEPASNVRQPAKTVPARSTKSPNSTKSPKRVGKPIVKGTRISVEFVVDLLGRGWSVEQVLAQYDHLTAADVQACLAYASEVLKSERVYLLPDA